MYITKYKNKLTGELRRCYTFTNEISKLQQMASNDEDFENVCDATEQENEDFKNSLA